MNNDKYLTITAITRYLKYKLDSDEHLKNVLFHGGIAFFIIEFVEHQETYLLDAKFVIEYFEHGSRKSIPYEEIKKIGHLIKRSYLPRLDYLPIVDEIYFK